jgi:hypothetical protein
MRYRAAAFGGAEVRGGGENGPISRRPGKSPSNGLGRPECSYDASLERCQAQTSGPTRRAFVLRFDSARSLSCLSDTTADVDDRT